MSVRVLAVLAPAVLPHEADESVEEVLGVMGSSSGLGMVLDGEGRQIQRP